MERRRGLQNVTLEMSLKPFKSVDAAYVARVCEKIFRQWRGLAAEAETVSVMLWTADGSEILDYKGRMDDRIEWARYIGGAKPPPPEPGKPPRTDLHAGIICICRTLRRSLTPRSSGSWRR